MKPSAPSVASPTVATPRVPFLDLAAGLRSIRAELDAALRRVLDAGWFVLGPEGESFESELAAEFGAAASVAVANGTEALQLALEACGVRAGDEVVTSPLTAAFTALAIVRAGARPVFADVEPATLNVSAATIERVLTPRTRAVVPVHLYGRPVDLDPVYDLASRRSLFVVEDACQAHGARYRGRRVGSQGTVALSFYPTKNLGALGDGGAVLVQDQDLASRLRELRNGGQRARYEHLSLGTNSRLDEIQAAALRAKLPHLDAWVARRRAIAGRYARALAGVGLALPPAEPIEGASAWHLFVVRHARRDALAAELRLRGVETLVHYPVPVHHQPAFSALCQGQGALPAAEAAAREVLSLPLFPEMTEDQVETVIAATREAVACVQ